MELTHGVYETLINHAIKKKIDSVAVEKTEVVKQQIDSAVSAEWMSKHLSVVVSSLLCEMFNEDDRKTTIKEQQNCINKILKFIEQEWNCDLAGDLLVETDEFLRGLYDKIGYTNLQIQDKSSVHPMSGYRVSSLFTGGGKDISVGSEIALDIKTADKIDLLVSFIKLRGWLHIADELKEFVKRPGSQLRVLTTTYMGATDEKAIRALYNLKDISNGSVEIKVSFNGDSDRLHAKVYGFYRNSGYHTAYVGSSNLSKEALTTGLEWNMRITQAENPHIIAKTQATFQQYWDSEEFEPVKTEEDLLRFGDAIYRIRHKGETRSGDDINAPEYVCRFIRKNHQIRVLDRLQYERNEKKSFRNLITRVRDNV